MEKAWWTSASPRADAGSQASLWISRSRLSIDFFDMMTISLEVPLFYP